MEKQIDMRWMGFALFTALLVASFAGFLYGVATFAVIYMYIKRKKTVEVTPLTEAEKAEAQKRNESFTTYVDDNDPSSPYY
ncbi:MAG: hypothetical protein R8L53_06305 [Mariprofundales bacterium]